MTSQTGKLTYEKKFQFFLNYEFGSKIFDGELNYHRLDALAIHQFRSKLGEPQRLNFWVESLRNRPIWKNFEIIGQTNGSSEKWTSKINTPSTLGFVTMPSGTFYADKFVSLQVSQYPPLGLKQSGKPILP